MADNWYTGNAGEDAGEYRGWLLGQGQRQRGSLSSDLWEGTADELAKRGHIAVFPAGGWWHRQKATDRAEMPNPCGGAAVMRRTAACTRL